MSSHGADKTVMTLWRRDCPAVFQILAVATGKARLPTVESLKGGTTRRLVPEERSERRPDTSATRLSSPIDTGARRHRELSGCLGGEAIRSSDFRSSGRGFDSRSGRKCTNNGVTRAP